jgi:type II secretory pathway component GspD/PulD (secretin)
MNLSLKTLTIALAASAALAIAQEVDNPGGAGVAPAAAVEKTKEVVAAVKEVAADAEVAAAPEVAADAEAAANAEVAAPAEAAAKAEAAAPAEAAADAEDAAPAEAAAPAEVAAPAEPAAATADVPDTEEEMDGVTVTSGEDPDKITVSLDAVELEDVVRLFTRLSGANIICNTTNLHGTVTANLANIGWQPALEQILNEQGLQLREEPPRSGVFVITQKPTRTPKPWDNWVTKTFPLKNVKATEAAKITESFLGVNTAAFKTSSSSAGKGAQPGAFSPQGYGSNKSKFESTDEFVMSYVYTYGRVVAYPAANVLVISTEPEIMRELVDIIDRIDVPREQIYIEAKFVQISGSAAKKIGIDWSILDGYTITAGPFARNYTRTGNRGTSSSDTHEKSASMVHTTDHAQYRGSAESSRVKSSSQTAESTTVDTEVNTFGPTYPEASPWTSLYRSSPAAVFTGNNGTWSSESSSDTAFSLNTHSKNHENTINDVRTAIFSAPALEVALSALETSDDIATISNPKLIVANEEHAIIDMTTKEPYVQLSKENNSENNSTSYSAELKQIPTGRDKNDQTAPYIEGAFFSYGISVDVTPRINNSSNITVVIEPMISTAKGYKKVVLDVATQTAMDYPIIDVKRVRTTFSLGNGQTAVIGGLTTTGDREVVKKVPLLGSIPILKYLFSHTEKVKEQYETIIFVTVGIVDQDNNETRMGLPDGARLVQKRIDENGKIIDKRFKDMETDEQKREADLREAETVLKDEIKEAEEKGLVVPETVEE